MVHEGSGSGRLDRLDRLLRRILGATVVVLMVAIAVVCLSEVVLRDLAGSSLGWYDEFVGYLLVALTFVGAAMAQQQGRHIGVQLLAARLGPGAERARQLIVNGLLLALQVWLVVAGAELALRSGSGRAITLPVSMGLVYATIPLGALLTALVTLVQVGRILQSSPGESAGGVVKVGESTP